MSNQYEVQNHGSVFILLPTSDAAKDWCNEHISEDAIRWCTGYVVEHRYIGDIINGLDEALEDHR